MKAVTLLNVMSSALLGTIFGTMGVFYVTHHGMPQPMPQPLLLQPYALVVEHVDEATWAICKSDENCMDVMALEDMPTRKDAI